VLSSQLALGKVYRNKRLQQYLPIGGESFFELSKIKLSISIHVMLVEDRAEVNQAVAASLSNDVLEIHVDFLDPNLGVDAEVCHFQIE